MLTGPVAGARRYQDQHRGGEVSPKLFERRVTWPVVSDTPSNAGTGGRRPEDETPDAAAPHETPGDDAPLVSESAAGSDAAPPEPDPESERETGLTPPEPTPTVEPSHASPEPAPDTPGSPVETIPEQVSLATTDVPPTPPPARPPVVAETADGDEDGPAPKRKARTWQFALLTLLAVGFLVGAFFIGQDSGDDAVPDVSTTTAGANAELATFTDKVTGFSISYPKDWEVLNSPPGDELRFAATPGGADAVTVRVSEVPFTVGTEPNDVSTEDAKQYTATLLADKGLTLVEQADLSLGDAPAFFYLYRFTDGESGVEGTHAHYFVFEGSTMSQMVFQALPTANYEGLVPVFARIVQSFKPPTSAPAPAPSTSVPPTSAPESSSTSTSQP